jgi:hypothetical protein
MRILFVILAITWAISCNHSLKAQDASQSIIATGPFPKCEKTDIKNETNDLLYTACFTPPDDQFYGQALVDFSIENTDLNGLLEASDKSTRKNILKTLGSLFLENTDVAHFVLWANAINVQGGSTSLGASKLFSIRKVGNKQYTLNSEKRYGPLPGRFLADPTTTQVEFTLRIVTERQVESKIARLLDKISKFAGVSIPTAIGSELTAVQRDFVALDKEISNALESKEVIGSFVPLHFEPKFAQSYESKFALKRHLPVGAGFRIRIATDFQTSIFPQVRQWSVPPSGSNQDTQDLMASPGGVRADQFKNVTFLGQNLTNHVLASLGKEDYNALRQTSDEESFYRACWKLDTYVQNGPLALTSADKLRVVWAHISGNALLKKKSVRDKYCLRSKEDDLKKYLLGLPEIEEASIPDSYFIIIDRAKNEATTANETVSEAISKRDEALTYADAAYRAVELESYRVESLGFFTFAGQVLVEGKALLGLAQDLVSNRKGNKYIGEVVKVDNRIVLQGLGQYTSASPSDGIGYQTFTGRFEGDLGTGHGEMRFHSGESFLGKFSRETPHGFGIWQVGDGTRYYVNTIDGERRGPAVKETADGKRVAGDFIAPTTFRANDE